jgi:hypothetical protein
MCLSNSDQEEKDRRKKPRRTGTPCDTRQCVFEGSVCPDCGRLVPKYDEPRPKPEPPVDHGI